MQQKDRYWSWSSSTFGHLIWRADSLEKTLMLGKTEGIRRSGWQRMRWLDSTIDPMDMNLSKLWEIVWDRKAWHATVLGVANSLTRLSDWTTKINVELSCGPCILSLLSLSANSYLPFHTVQPPLPQGILPKLFSPWRTSNYVLWWHRLSIPCSMRLHWTFPVSFLSLPDYCPSLCQALRSSDKALISPGSLLHPEQAAQCLSFCGHTTHTLSIEGSREKKKIYI